MGITKQYLAYKPLANFNIISSGRPNVNFVIYDKIEGRYCIVGASENAILWDLRLGCKVVEFNRDKQEVTALRVSPDRMHVAVAYLDGVVEVFDIYSNKSICSLALHKTAITILRYDNLGMRLISGGMDTELVVTDVVGLIGKNRLIGHNAPITDAHFLEKPYLNNNNICISSSKDTQIKFWNLETNTCFKTIVDNRTEVWALALIGDFLMAGSGDNEINVYKLSKVEDLNGKTNLEQTVGLVEGLSIDDTDTTSPIKVINCGSIQRAGKGRTVSLVADNTERVLSCHGTNDLIENFYFCNIEEAAIRLKKRLKKLTNNDNEISKDISLVDEIKRLPSIKIGEKIKSIDVVVGLNDELRLLVNLANNSMQLHAINIRKKKSGESELLRSITNSGHQSEVRSVCFSSDSTLIASGSGNSLKLWHRDSVQCLKTVLTEYILCCCFVPGDRHVLLGLKNGALLIVDIAAGEIIEEIAAHTNELWSICLLPNLKGCVTGGSDCTVKIWNFELIDEQNDNNPINENYNDILFVQKTKILSLLHTNTLKLEESILCVKVSPNGKFLIVGLLDSTVKMFFLDSFKFYLSLYGHKLPVLCMDVSDDSSLIATGSADRNIKIWGLDFGDCHRSLFAHDDSVMSIQFIPKTHMLLSCGKDGKIKQWDADSFEKIITLSGHNGEAFCLSISTNGKFFATCGSDRTIRLFERSDETIVLQDIQEQEREQKENEILATGDENNIPTLPGLKLPSRKTVGSEMAAESILECLMICKQFETEIEDQQVELHPLMKAYNVKNSNDFIIAVLEKIRASDMEEALLLLPFSDVCDILQRIPQLAETRRDQSEIISKVTLFLFRIHQKPIASNQTLVNIIIKIIETLREVTIELRDMIGVNYHALQLLQQNIEEHEGIELFSEATTLKKKNYRKQRQRELKRIHIQMS